MMYFSKFVAAILVNGKILREFNDTIKIPFGTEYSILMKNLSYKRALVDVIIDGRIACEGLVINPSESVELERFLNNNNLDNGYKFKFIEKTSKICEYRDNNIEDGIISINWKYEKPKNKTYFDTKWISSQYLRSSRKSNYFNDEPYYKLDTKVYCSDNESNNTLSISSAHESYCNTDGITVEGGDSNQKFVETTIGELENTSHFIVFHLVGVNNPIYVKDKIKCEYCGTSNSSKNKFCFECGARIIN